MILYTQSRKSCIAKTLAFGVAITAIMYAPVATCDEPKSATKTEGTLWESVKRVSAPEMEEPLEPDVYWSRIQMKTAPIVAKAVGDAKNNEHDLLMFVDGFKDATGNEKLRWILAGDRLVIPFHHVGFPKFDDSKMDLGVDLICKCETNNMVRDPYYREMYYRTVAWATGFLARSIDIDTESSLVKQGFARDNKDQYWFWARNATLIIYSTGRSDLLEDASPEKMNVVFATWYDWYAVKENKRYLRLNHDKIRWRLDESAVKKHEPVKFDDGCEVPPPPFVCIPLPPSVSLFRHF